MRERLLLPPKDKSFFLFGPRGTGKTFWVNWRTASGLEVDFVLYGPRGLHAIEIKRSRTIHPGDLRALQTFGKDYPEAQLTLLYGGAYEQYQEKIRILPIEKALLSLRELL